MTGMTTRPKRNLERPEQPNPWRDAPPWAYVLDDWLADIYAQNERILALLEPKLDIVATGVSVIADGQPAPTALGPSEPSTQLKETIMAGTPQTLTLTLAPTDVQTITLGLIVDGTQTSAPIPPTDTFSATSPSPAIGVAVSGNTVTVNALTQPSANTMGMEFNVTDSAGDTQLEVTVDYPVVAVDDIVGTVVVTPNGQPAPTAPGP
jgi:hypothetical protein